MMCYPAIDALVKKVDTKLYPCHIGCPESERINGWSSGIT